MVRFSVLLFAFIATIAGLAQPKILVLGNAQDGGYPQVGCMRECCSVVRKIDSLQRYVVSLALIDPATKKWWLLEATPDIKYQLQLFGELTNHLYPFLPDGIFITHAHIGHYAGLMQLGREVMNSKHMPVYVLPKLKKFFEENGPWSQLVTLENISLMDLKEEVSVILGEGILVTPFTVPHRDEFSETCGFKIQTPLKRYLFIPDIDKWSKWKRSIIDEVKSIDIAFLDATFYSDNELPNRNMNAVPHPLVKETMELFRNESNEQKKKIQFIHLNHTNPLLFDKRIQNYLLNQGFGIAQPKQEY